MGLFAAIEIAVNIKKGLIFPIRSVRSRPFILATVIFFFLLYGFLPSAFGFLLYRFLPSVFGFLLYRFLPTVFGFLLSSCPIIVCTAALLQTFFSFGIYRYEEEKKTSEISCPGRFGEGDLITEKDDGFSSQNPPGRRSDVKEKLVKEVDVSKRWDAKGSEEKRKVFSTTQDNGLRGRTIVIKETQKQVHDKDKIKEDRDFCNPRSVRKREFHREKPLIASVSGNVEEVEVLKNEIEGLNEDIDKPSYHDSSLEQFKDHTESPDSGSDHAGSSSADASGAISECSHKSNDDSGEMEDEARSQEAEDENEDANGGQMDGIKAVAWTEDDAKNLMDLGTSELERNRRLENLIAKRRAQKIWRIEAEKNLIDLDSIELPQYTSISTKRINPLVIPYYSNESVELPPIPGSAPSVLLPTRNPFDLPYDPLEERPNLMEDSFQQEFMAVQQKDIFFSRHESFCFGPSFSAEFTLNPYFVTEQMASERVGYPTFQEQLSERSDSMVSSSLEAESLSLVADVGDHKKLTEQELSQQGGESHHPDCTHGLVEQGSQTTKETVDSMEIDQEEQRAVDVNGVEKEITHEMDSGMIDRSEVYMKPDEAESFAGPGSSSSLEIDEKILHVNKAEGLENLEPTMAGCAERNSNSLKPLLVDCDPISQIVEGMDSGRTEEPLYDSSPLASEKKAIDRALFYVDKGVILTSTSSIASDLQVEVSEVGSPPAPVKRNILLTDGDTTLHEGSIKEEMTSGNEMLSADSSHQSEVDENESTQNGITEISKCDTKEIRVSGANQNCDDPISVPMVPESMVIEQVLINSVPESVAVEQVSIDLSSTSSQKNEIVEEGPIDQVPSTSSDPKNPFIEEKVEPVTSNSSQPLMQKPKVQPSPDCDREENQESFILPGNSTEEAIIESVNELVIHETEHI